MNNLYDFADERKQDKSNDDYEYNKKSRRGPNNYANEKMQQ